MDGDGGRTTVRKHLIPVDRTRKNAEAVVVHNVCFIYNRPLPHEC